MKVEVGIGQNFKILLMFLKEDVRISFRTKKNQLKIKKIILNAKEV